MALRFLKAASKAVKKAAKTKAAKSATQQAAQLKKAKLLEKARKAREAKAAKLLAEQKARKAAIKKAKSTSIASDNAKKPNKPTTKKASVPTSVKETGGAPKTVKTKPTPKKSTVKSKASLSETLRRRQARRGTRPTQVSKSKTDATNKRNALKEVSGKSNPRPTGKAVRDQRDKRGRLTKEALAARRKESRSRLKTSESKGKSLTKAEKERLQRNKDRDIGAQATAAKTPKSVKKTVSQAGGPAKGKGRDVPNSTDLTARQRDGKATLGKPQPKGTNPRQTPSGRSRTNARDRAASALKKFNKEKRILDMKERLKADKSLSGTERQAKIRAETKKINEQAQGLRAQVEDKMRRRQEAARNNVSPGKSDASDQSLGRDWRNRLSDKRSQQMSEHMTRITSGKPVRTNGELLQTPKGTGRSRQSANDPVTKTDKARRNASARSNSGTGSFNPRGSGKPAESRAIKKAEPSKTTRRIKSKSGETVVTRPTPSPRSSNTPNRRVSTTLSDADRKQIAKDKKKGESKTKIRSRGSETQAQQTMAAVRKRAQTRKAAQQILQGNQEQHRRFNGNGN